MKFLTMISILFSYSAHAQIPSIPASTQYFKGGATIYEADGVTVKVKPVAYLKKIYDPEHSQAIERGLVIYPDGKIQDDTTTFSVTGNHFTVSDARKIESGFGDFTGEAWNWTYFKATYFLDTVERDDRGKIVLDVTTGAPVKLKIQIEDENTLTPAVITGSHTIAVDGKPYEVWDLKLEQISESQFNLETARYSKP